MASQSHVPLHYDNQLQFSLARLNLGIAVVFGTLAVIAFLLRVIARRQTKARLQSDDWVMCVAMIISLALCIMSAWATVHGGLGVPAQYLSQATAIAFLKQTFVQELLSTAAIGLIKVSVCLFYKRVFYVNKTFVTCINVMIALSVGWTLAFFLALTFSYWPVSGHWMLNGTVKHNLNFGALIIAMAATGVALDAIVLSMPIPMVQKLQLSPRKKWIVGSIFSLGAFCVVASIIRLVYIVKFLKVSGHNTADAFTHAENQIAIWSNIEPCASVFSACLPTYGPFLRKAAHGDSMLGRSLSEVIRIRLNHSMQSSKGFFGRKSKSKGEKASNPSTNHVSSTDDSIGDIQTKGNQTITVSRTFAVFRQTSSDSDEAPLTK